LPHGGPRRDLHQPDQRAHDRRNHDADVREAAGAVFGGIDSFRIPSVRNTTATMTRMRIMGRLRRTFSFL